MRTLVGLLRRALSGRLRHHGIAAVDGSTTRGNAGAIAIWVREFARSRWKTTLPRHTTEVKEGPWRPKPPQHPRPRRKRSRFQLMAAKRIIDEWEIDKSDEEQERKSKNQMRREAAKALQMAKLLSTFTKRQIRDAVKFAFLPSEALQATLLVQKLKEEGVREGKRRQYNYIARLIRTAEPNLVEFVFTSLRDGHTQKMKKVIEAATSTERDKQVALTTERWVRGLLSRDENVMKEIYSLPPEVVDRAELRSLIQEVRANASKKDKPSANDPLQGFLHTSLWRAKKALSKFVSKAALYDYKTRAALAQKDEPGYLEGDDAVQLEEDRQAEKFLDQSASELLEDGSRNFQKPGAEDEENERNLEEQVIEQNRV